MRLFKVANVVAVRFATGIALSALSAAMTRKTYCGNLLWQPCWFETIVKLYFVHSDK